VVVVVVSHWGLPLFVGFGVFSVTGFAPVSRVVLGIISVVVGTSGFGLSSSALIAVVEALRTNADRYAIIYDTKYDSDENVPNSSSITAPRSSSSSTYSSFPKAYQNYYYNKYHEGILELAKGFFNILLNQLVDKTMVAAAVKSE
jgi:hypothetical protein